MRPGDDLWVGFFTINGVEVYPRMAKMDFVHRHIFLYRMPLPAAPTAVRAGCKVKLSTPVITPVRTVETYYGWPSVSHSH